jgi:hypothetical protein
MAELKVGVHVQYAIDFGPVSRFVPPQAQITQKADDGGGMPVEPLALSFLDPDGEMHVYVVSDASKTQLVAALTGGIVVAGGGH